MAPVKVIITWNIKTNNEEEYFKFVMHDFMPKVNAAGLEVTDAWATVYGDAPQILVGAIMPSFEEARKLLESEEWLALASQLMEYVDDFKVKIVNPKGAFQF